MRNFISTAYCADKTISAVHNAVLCVTLESQPNFFVRDAAA